MLTGLEIGLRLIHQLEVYFQRIDQNLIDFAINPLKNPTFSLLNVSNLKHFVIYFHPDLHPGRINLKWNHFVGYSHSGVKKVDS